MSHPKVPYDPELASLLAQIPTNPLTLEVLPASRLFMSSTYTVDSIVSSRPVTHEDRTIPGPDGNELQITIFRSKNTAEGGNKPGVYFVHGGGLVLGNRFLGLKESVIEWVEDLDAVLVTIEYRLAPEYPYPAPLEDCYVGLKWIASNFEELGIDPNKLLLSGASAGGGLAAGVALLARDRKGPKLCAQHLQYPMLDDRNTTLSSQQYTTGPWSRTSNLLGWGSYLGEKAGGEDVEIYAAPGRATDLSGLPEAYVEVGSAELFRDEVVKYAEKLWASGVQAELHVWPGVWHGSDMLFPTAVLSKVAKANRIAWGKRIFAALEK